MEHGALSTPGKHQQHWYEAGLWAGMEVQHPYAQVVRGRALGLGAFLEEGAEGKEHRV